MKVSSNFQPYHFCLSWKRLWKSKALIQSEMMLDTEIGNKY